MRTLNEAGIGSIGLNPTESGADNEGYTIGYTGTFTWADGSTGAAASVDFQTDPANTAADETDFEPSDKIALLPSLPRQGFLDRERLSLSCAWPDVCVYAA